MNLLEVKSIYKTYGSGEATVKALQDVSFTVPKGEFVAVVGESGSGKSTLLNIMGALDSPTSGKVLIDGKDIYQMKDKELTIFRRRNIGFIFQAFNLIPELSVEQNMIFPLLLDHRRPNQKYLNELLSVLGLENRRSHLPSQLSGGQQQRVALARTLAQNPKIILADEPVAALDPVTAKQVMQDFVRINKDMGISILLNIHHVELAIEYADRIIGIRAGQIVYDGPAKAVDQTVLNSIYGDSVPQEETA